MPVERVDYLGWLLRVVTWDAVLPVCVAFVPPGVELLFPNRRGVMELTAVTLPVVAFLVRIVVGRRHIASNQCSVVVRRVQFVVFCFGILPLVLIECAFILSRLMPKGAFGAGDLFVCAVLYSIYLICMVFAMYPWRTIPTIDPDELAFFPGGRGDDDFGRAPEVEFGD